MVNTFIDSMQLHSLFRVLQRILLRSRVVLPVDQHIHLRAGIQTVGHEETTNIKVREKKVCFQGALRFLTTLFGGLGLE